VVDAALRYVAQDEARASRLAQRFKRLANGSVKTTASLVLTSLAPGPQQRWFSIMAAAETEWFAGHASDLYEKVVEVPSELDPYQRAVLEFLRSSEGERTRRQIATWNYGLFSGDEIELNLEKILDVQESPPEEAEASGNVATPVSRRSWAERLQPFLPPILHALLFRKAEAANESLAPKAVDKEADDKKVSSQTIAKVESGSTMPFDKDHETARVSSIPQDTVLTPTDVNEGGRVE